MSRTTPTEPLSWRRIGALSSTVNLHVLAVAAAFLAMNAPRTPLDLVRAPPPPMTVDLRDPPPIEAPVVPVAETVPPVSRPEPRPRPLPVVDEAIPAVATGAAASLEAPPDSRFAPVAADTASTPAVPPGEAASVAYDHAPAPAYPPLSRTRGEEGEVLLRVLVGVDGRTTQVRLHRSSGHARLDRSALNAVQRWRFRPARVDGVPREAWIVIPVNFSLGRG